MHQLKKANSKKRKYIFTKYLFPNKETRIFVGLMKIIANGKQI